MKWNSLIVKVTVILFVFMAAVNTAAYLFIDSVIENQVNDRIRQEAGMVLQSLDWAISPLMDTEEKLKAQRLIENVGSNSIVSYLRVCDSNGTIVFANNPQDVGQKMHLSGLEGIFTQKSLQLSLHDPVDGSFIMGVPVRGTAFSTQRGSDIQAVLLMKVDHRYQSLQVDDVRNRLVTFSLIVNLILLSVVGFVLYRYVAKPLQVFRKASESIARRDYKIDLSGNFRDEFMDLSKAFGDMTEDILQYTEELRAARDLAEESAKVKMQFLANMSHEIRTPLNSIISYTDLLEESETDPDKKQKLAVVKRSGGHLLEIISDILDVSKLELSNVDLEAVPFSILELMLDLNRFYMPVATAHNLRLRIEVSPSVPKYLAGDVHRIRQILSNLVGNALKFTSKGSVTMVLEYADDQLEIKVTDTGVGIDEKSQHRIFDAFAQSDMSTTRLYGGTGLGLTICKKLTEAMGGQISLESEFGKGSEFTVRLPLMIPEEVPWLDMGEERVLRWLTYDIEISDLAEYVLQSIPERMKLIEAQLESDDLAALKETVHAFKGVAGNFHMEELYQSLIAVDAYLKNAESNVDGLTGLMDELRTVIAAIPIRYLGLPVEVLQEIEHTEPALRILLAEDVEENRTLIQHMLKTMNVLILEAANGVEALQVLEKESIDLLLLDMQMPVMDGLQVLQNLKGDNRKKDLTIIALTANATNEDRDHYLEWGCDRFVSKPVKKELLRDIIAEMIEKKS